MDQEEQQMLAEFTSLDYLLVPLTRSARLKYNCMSVSSRFIALGSNTGGIYLFNRETCSFIQVVFSGKDTSPVLMASLSPNDKYVAMVTSSRILHVIDLKVESRARPETLRSTTDWGGTLTFLHWDVSCTKLYYGDSMGGVCEMTVHSSKAKNLFSLPPEPILKLDSSIVQIDKAGEKLLVSTMTRCYLCDTSKQQFFTIGKKLRDGQFGACFLCQGSSPSIYCARPGSRMWEATQSSTGESDDVIFNIQLLKYDYQTQQDYMEYCERTTWKSLKDPRIYVALMMPFTQWCAQVDIEGNVMNTHQFKQLLAISPLPVVKIKEQLQLPKKDDTSKPQSLNFPRLKIISGCYILTWTESCIYILDPVNIKVVLWSQPFIGIQDVLCLNNEIFILLPSMQVHCLSLMPVSRVTAFCFKYEAYLNAASLCVRFENSFCLKRKPSSFDLNAMKSLYDILVKENRADLVGKLHSVIVDIERKLAALSDSVSLGSNKSRTNSFVEKDTVEKSSDWKVENASLNSHNIETVDNLESQVALKREVNETEHLSSQNEDKEATVEKCQLLSNAFNPDNLGKPDASTEDTVSLELKHVNGDEIKEAPDKTNVTEVTAELETEGASNEDTVSLELNQLNGDEIKEAPDKTNETEVTAELETEGASNEDTVSLELKQVNGDEIKEAPDKTNETEVTAELETESASNEDTVSLEPKQLNGEELKEAPDKTNETEVTAELETEGASNEDTVSLELKQVNGDEIKEAPDKTNETEVTAELATESASNEDTVSLEPKLLNGEELKEAPDKTNETEVTAELETEGKGSEMTLGNSEDLNQSDSLIVEDVEAKLEHEVSSMAENIVERTVDVMPSAVSEAETEKELYITVSQHSDDSLIAYNEVKETDKSDQSIAINGEVKVIDTFDGSKMIQDATVPTIVSGEKLSENGLSVAEADKIDQNQYNLPNVNKYNKSRKNESQRVCNENVKNSSISECESMKAEFEPNVSVELGSKEHDVTVITTNTDNGIVEVCAIDIHSESTTCDGRETLADTEHSPIKSRSSTPSWSTQKISAMDDILEDDLDLQNRSSNMGSRRTSLTSLSSLSSAEVYMETFTGNSQEVLAIPVKKKSSKRRQRQSPVEGTGEAKKKGVKINRSFSAGAIQTRIKKEFSVSPQGSLDLTIEEDCITAADSEFSQNQQKMVSQSLPNTTRAEGYARSFSAAEQNQPVLDFRDSADLDKDSTFSRSAEFSRSEEFARSDEFSESPLLRSFDGTRDGISASPKTALKHLKDRVQKNLKSQTKRVITNIKDKNLLTRAKEFLSQPIDHPRSEFFVQAHDYEYQSDVAPKRVVQSVDEIDSVPHSPVDISALQDITAETQKKLEDPSLLLNPNTVYKILLDWVTVLNKTFHSLHVMKYAQSALIGPVGVSDNETNESSQANVNKTTENLSDTESIGNKENTTGMDTNKFQCSSVSDTLKNEGPGACILNDKDFCYTKDPLFLQTDVFSSVSELAQACFDFCCHGNILQFKNLYASPHQGKNDPTLISVKDCDKTLSEHLNNFTDRLITETKDFNNAQDQLSGHAHYSKDDGFKYDKDSFDNSAKGTCDESSKYAVGSECIEAALTDSRISSSDNCGFHKNTTGAGSGFLKETETVSRSDSIENQSADSTKIPLDQPSDRLTDINVSDYKSELNRNKDLEICSGRTGKVESCGHQNCDSNHYNDLMDKEIAFFVRCYFPYLSAIKIRNKTKERGKSWHQTWGALVSCLQALACDDSERYGVDSEETLRHVVESLSPKEDGYVLLGHVSRLFTMKSDTLVSTCVRCHPYIQPFDVLNMCLLHGVAIEVTFKSYMLQMIEDAKRMHRKDTISALYTHLEVKRVWLDILLSEEGNQKEMIDSCGNPCVMSHTHVWRNQTAIETIISQTENMGDKHMVLELCFKYGYWNGCLKILKDLENYQKQADLILHLDDVRLFNARSPIGYLPSNIERWKQLLLAYKNHSNSIPAVDGDSQSSVIAKHDWSDRITWNNLGSLLVRHLGPSQAVTLLQEMDIPESGLTASFYQTCAMSGLVHRHQRLILHSMLEKVDTYLWAQRPVYSSPQLHHIVVKEKELQSKGGDSAQQDHLQKLIQQLKSEHNELQRQYVEDPDCHWGVETKINLICPCCNIPLKEPVSLVEPGVILFKCGHGYHRMCLPERDCFLCTDEVLTSQENTFI